MKVFQIENPMWLSDIFVFMEFQFEKDKHVQTVYVKINHLNKIEEIGIDIVSRLHLQCTFEDFMKSERITKATRLQFSIINRIDKEYWWHIKNNLKNRII